MTHKKTNIQYPKPVRARASDQTRPVAVIPVDVASQVIQTLATGSFDPMKVAVELAKRDSVLFLDIVAQTNAAGAPVWYRDVVSSVRGGQVINAIKTVREHTGFGLKTAKDLVDAIVPYVHKTVPHRVPLSPASLDSDALAHFNNLAAAAAIMP